jgi:hypothetical protein
MNKKTNLGPEIILKDRERAIYLIHLQEGDNRFVNALKILFLRDDFYKFLDEYRELLSGNILGDIKFSRKEKMVNNHLVVSNSVDLHWEKANVFFKNYLNKIDKIKYLNVLPDNKKRMLTESIYNLLSYYYPLMVFTREAKGNSGVLIYDKMLDYSKITYSVLYKEDLNKYFPTELLSRNIPTFGYLSEEESKKPRVLLMFCDEDTNKEEFLNFIDNEWGEISSYLKRGNETSKDRDRAYKYLIRDIDVYNIYINEKGSVSEREIKTKEKIDEKYGYITSSAIKKAVVTISKLRKEINSIS